jgi:hypothetical protein
MAEFLVRFVFEVVLYGLLEFAGSIGRFIARTVVPLFAGKRILIEPAPGSLVVMRRWHGLHRLTDGTPVLGQGLAATVGFLILAAAVAIAIIVGVWLRA